jgi:ribosomal protein L29
MKKKDKEQLHRMTPEELRKERDQLQKKVRDFTVNRSVKTIKNVREGREMRKRIAVIQTFLRAGELLHE